MAASKLFEGICKEDMDTLLDCLSAKKQTYPKNTFVFSAGDHAAVTGLVVNGSLQIVKEDYWGKRTIIELLTPGEVFGEAFSCAEMETIPVSVVASEETEVLLMDYQKLVSVCPSSCPFHARVVRNMMKILAKKNIALMQKMEHITKRSTREKLLSYLSAQALLQGSDSVTIPFDRQGLADYLSVERSAMSAELGKMKAEGLIGFRKNRFTLMKKE